MKHTTLFASLLLLVLANPTWANEEHAHEKETSEKHGHEENAHDDEPEGEHNDEHGHDDEDGHDDEGSDGHGSHGGHEEHGEASSDAELSDAQRRMAGIETLVVRYRTLSETISAPGEVALNAYRTSKLTPRIPAQVMKRHARLGDHVKKGQPLVTLSSVEMAEAQGALMEADVERRRVEKLGRQVVSEKRFVTAQIAYQQAYAKVRAYGMTAPQILQLLKRGDATKATGEFALLATQSGTVMNDDFITGEIIEPGHVLFVISDEHLLWVKARLTPEAAANVAIGAPARIKVGTRWLNGKVIQSRHELDEATRTLAVRVEVPNPDDSLHPGQFVTVVIESKEKKQGIAVPLAAVLRAPDGDWQVFVETAPGRFEPKEVEILATIADQMLIHGIEAGATIISKGAFFVQSEIAKSGFSVHNH